MLERDNKFSLNIDISGDFKEEKISTKHENNLKSLLENKKNNCSTNSRYQEIWC